MTKYEAIEIAKASMTDGWAVLENTVWFEELPESTGDPELDWIEGVDLFDEPRIGCTIVRGLESALWYSRID